MSFARRDVRTKSCCTLLPAKRPERHCITSLKHSDPKWIRADFQFFECIGMLISQFSLQVKDLDTGKLRYRLSELWRHWENLECLQGRFTIKSWWRRTSRPWVEEDDHGVFAFRPKRKTISPTLTENHAHIIREEIAGSTA